jgi:sulfate adenylyltransferase subunit 1
VVCDVYDSHQGTGAFVLIDEATHHTVAAGMIRAFSA